MRGKVVKDKWTVVFSPFLSGSDNITDIVEIDTGDRITSLMINQSKYGYEICSSRVLVRFFKWWVQTSVLRDTSDGGKWGTHVGNKYVCICKIHGKLELHKKVSSQKLQINI